MKEYPKFKRGEVESIYVKLSKKEQEIIKKYIEYRKARGNNISEALLDIRRQIIQFRYVTKTNFNDIDLEKLRSFLALFNPSSLSDFFKNNMKINVENFLKWKFDNWSKRFKDFDDIRLKSNPKNEKKLNSSAILTQEDIKKIMSHETKMYWKAFFMIQYEGALRTKETRYLKWEDVKFDVDEDISELNIYSSKTSKARTIFIKEATFYLKKLKEEQENLDQKGIYIFNRKSNINIPVDKSSVSIWARGLSEKSGKYFWNYLLRHSRATELYRLAKKSKIAKDTAIDFMGHSADMSKVYTHLDKNEVKDMLRNQIYKLEELPAERKNELEKQIEELKANQDKLAKALLKLSEKNMNKFL